MRAAWFAFAVALLASSAAFAQAPSRADPAAALAPGALFRDCADCPDMVVIPAGRFTMGSALEQGADNERPAHPVAIVQPFALARFPITRAAFARFVRATAYQTACGWETARQASENDPVVSVSWQDAAAYVWWLGATSRQVYRLPSEAEWEYAARAGTATEFWWGDDALVTPLHANGAGRADGFDTTSPVGRFKPNPFGLYDMAGNAWQWTADCYNARYDGAPTDGTPWLAGTCTSRVVRGGSWYDAPPALGSASRVAADIVACNDNIGFRVARSLDR